MKTPEEIADALLGAHMSQRVQDAENEVRALVKAAIEADRAQRTETEESRCINCGAPVFRTQYGEIRDWKHVAQNGDSAFWNCSMYGGPSGKYAEVEAEASA